MSVAIDFASDFAGDYADDCYYYAERHQGGEAGGDAARLATVTALHAPPAHTITAPLRLTRRGVHVVAGAVAVLAIGLVALARVSAPSGGPSGSGHASVPASVTVRAGDTLWTIASRLAPQTDPQSEIAELQQVNHLGGVALVPGQVLRTH